MRRFATPLLLFVAALGTSGCTGARTDAPAPRAEAVSLTGQPLAPPAIPPDRLTRLEANLREARAAYEHDPASEDAAIWYGRRLAYLGRFRGAIALYTDGLAKHPGSHRLLRHRGHRYITVREFDRALADLTRAAQLAANAPDAVEPDGEPNEQHQPRSTDKSNIYYHLGLVQYLMGDFDAADRTFALRAGLAAYNDDMLVSTTHWRYLAMRRLGRGAQARELLEPINTSMDVVENHSYHRLCLYYKGLVAESEALGRAPDGKIDPAAAYGVSMVRWINGDKAGARRLWREILDTTNWGAFGHIAAEAEVAREQGRR